MRSSSWSKRSRFSCWLQACDLADRSDRGFLAGMLQFSDLVGRSVCLLHQIGGAFQNGSPQR